MSDYCENLFRDLCVLCGGILDCTGVQALWAKIAKWLPRARIFHESLSRGHEDGRANRQPQGVGSEAYLKGTSQEPTPEDARKDGHIRGRSK